MSVQPQPRPLLSKEDEAAEQAARVRAMLARWEQTSDRAEPDWDVDQLVPVSFRPRDREPRSTRG